MRRRVTRSQPTTMREMQQTRDNIRARKYSRRPQHPTTTTNAKTELKVLHQQTKHQQRRSRERRGRKLSHLMQVHKSAPRPDTASAKSRFEPQEQRARVQVLAAEHEASEHAAETNEEHLDAGADYSRPLRQRAHCFRAP